MIQTYGVRGLTCWRCMVSVIDEVSALPGVDGVQVDLVPFGESRVSVVPEGAVTRDQVRASLGRAGFDPWTRWLTQPRRTLSIPSSPGARRNTVPRPRVDLPPLVAVCRSRGAECAIRRVDALGLR